MTKNRFFENYEKHNSIFALHLSCYELEHKEIAFLYGAIDIDIRNRFSLWCY